MAELLLLPLRAPPSQSCISHGDLAEPRHVCRSRILAYRSPAGGSWPASPPPSQPIEILVVTLVNFLAISLCFLDLVVSNRTIDQFCELCIITQSYLSSFRCFFYGDLSPQKDVETYTAYSFNLYDHFVRTYYQIGEAYNPEKPPLPLIINTSGWIRGAGYTLLVRMLSYTSPSLVVQLRVERERYNLPTGRFWLDGNPTRPNFIELNPSWKTPKNPLSAPCKLLTTLQYMCFLILIFIILKFGVFEVAITSLCDTNGKSLN